MPSIVSKISRFARSPQGRKLTQRGRSYASSPQGRRQIDTLRRRFSGRR